MQRIRVAYVGVMRVKGKYLKAFPLPRQGVGMATGETKRVGADEVRTKQDETR